MRLRYLDWWRDLPRILAMLGLGLLLTMADRGLVAVAYVVGIVMVLVATAHILRRILMPRVDIQHMIHQSMLSPVGAGLAVLGVLYLLATIIQVGGGLLG